MAHRLDQEGGGGEDAPHRHGAAEVERVAALGRAAAVLGRRPPQAPAGDGGRGQRRRHQGGRQQGSTAGATMAVTTMRRISITADASPTAAASIGRRSGSSRARRDRSRVTAVEDTSAPSSAVTVSPPVGPTSRIAK